MSTTVWFIFWFFIFLKLGAVWYVLDRTKLRSVYRWWYNVSHENDLAADAQQGFIFNQKTSPRFRLALFLSLVQVLIIALFTKQNILIYSMTWLIGIPALMLGFIAGPWFDWVWQRKEKAFQAVDNAMGRLDRGESPVPFKPVVDATRQAVQENVDRGREVVQNLSRAGQRTSSTGHNSTSSTTEVITEKSGGESRVDGRSMIDQFTRGQSPTAESGTPPKADDEII